MGRFCFLGAKVKAVAEMDASEAPLGVAYFRPAGQEAASPGADPRERTQGGLQVSGWPAGCGEGGNPRLVTHPHSPLHSAFPSHTGWPGSESIKSLLHPSVYNGRADLRFKGTIRKSND